MDRASLRTMHARVTEVMVVPPETLDDILITFELTNDGRKHYPEYFPVKDNTYSATGGEISGSKDTLNSSTFREYLIYPIEAYVRNKKIEDRRALLKVLRQACPWNRLDEEEVDNFPISEPTWCPPPLILPYLAQLYDRGKIKIKVTDHIGSARGLDAANMLRREINLTMISSISTGYSIGTQNPVRHNVSGKSIILEFESKALLKLFQKIYEVYFHH